MPPSGTGPRPYATVKPLGTGHASGIPSDKPQPFNISSNATCGGATFNIISGSLEWWYTSAIAFGTSTFSQQYNYNDSATGWTLLPATTTFNVTSALARPTYISYTTFNTYVNMSLVYESEYTTATPVFASTALITQTATRPVNTTSGKGLIPSNVILTPAPASTVLPGAALTALTNTPFVYFTKYAIDRQQPVSYWNGSRACATEREIYTLDAPYAIYYSGSNPDGQTEVGGALPTDILEQLEFSGESVTLGTWAASPTLLVVVEVVYAAQGVLAASVTAEASSTAGSPAVLSMVVPSATLLTPAPASAASAAVAVTQTSLQTPGHFIVPAGVAWIAHIEVSETALDTASTTLLTVNVGTDASPTVVPFVGHLGTSKFTFLAPEPTGGDTVTTTVDGSVVVATPLTNSIAISFTTTPPAAVALQQPTSTESPGIGAIVSAIQAGSGVSDSSSGSSGSKSGSSSSNSGPGSGSSLSSSSPGSSGDSTGSGTTDNPAPAQPSPGIGSLISAIESVAHQSAADPVATALANTGSSSGEVSSAGSSTAGSSSGDSSTSGSSEGSSESSSSSSPAPGGSSSAGGSSEDSPGGSQSGGSTSSVSSSENSSPDSPGSSSGSSSSSDSGTQSSSDSDSGTGSNSGSSVVAVVPVPISIGTVQATVGPSSKLVLGTQTLVLNGPPITISGTPVSLGPSAVVVGAVTHTFIQSVTQEPEPIAAGESPSPSIASVITVGGSTITQAPVPVFVVGGQTIPSDGFITVSGAVISVAPSNNAVVIGSNTISFAIPASAVILTTAGQTITISPTPAFIVGGQTLAAGGTAITVGGTRLSLAPSATAIMVGSSTSDLTLDITTAGVAAPPLLTIGSDTFTANAATQFLLASGAVLTPGGVVTISGTTVSLDSSASEIVLNGVTKTLSPPVLTPAPIITVGGTAYEANLGSTYEIDRQVLTPGGVITVSGSTILLASDASAIVVNGMTQTLTPVAGSSGSVDLTMAPALTIAGQTYSANSGSSYIISGQILTPGGVITLSGGTTISLAPSASDVIINGVTSTLPPGSVKTPSPVLTVNGQTYTANAGSSYTIDGQTLTPGGSVILPGGTTLSLAPAGSNLVINGFTSAVPAAPATIPTPVLTIDGQTYVANSGSSYIINGQTLTPDGTIILSGGTTVSLAPSASDLVINGATSAISAPTITAAPILTIDGQTYTAASGSAGDTYIISGQTLTPGGIITIKGPNGPETISLAPSATALIVAVSGATTISTLPTAYGTLQPAAPVLTIGDSTFTALPGAGPSYLINGQTLTAGGAALTETISNHVFIVSLSPSATILIIEEEGPGGQVTATEYETLFPPTVTRGRSTATVTEVIGGATGGSAGTATQTVGASGSSGPEASLQNTAFLDKKVGTALGCGAGIVALLAAML